jgi:hypothetical protein
MKPLGRSGEVKNVSEPGRSMVAPEPCPRLMRPRLRHCPFCETLLPSKSQLKAHLVAFHRGRLQLAPSRGNATASSYVEWFDDAVHGHQRQLPFLRDARCDEFGPTVSPTTSVEMDEAQDRMHLAPGFIRKDGEGLLTPLPQLFDSYLTLTSFGRTERSRWKPNDDQTGAEFVKRGERDRLETSADDLSSSSAFPSQIILIDAANLAPKLFEWWEEADPYADRFLALSTSPALIILVTEPSVNASPVLSSHIAALLAYNRRLIIHSVPGGSEAGDHALAHLVSYFLCVNDFIVDHPIADSIASHHDDSVKTFPHQGGRDGSMEPLTLHVATSDVRLGNSLLGLHRRAVDQGMLHFHDFNDEHPEGRRVQEKGSRVGAVGALSNLISFLEHDAAIKRAAGAGAPSTNVKT